MNCRHIIPRITIILAVAAACATAASPTVHAQLAPLDRSDPWRAATSGAARVADSLAQSGDTAQALVVLQRALTASSSDADAWHRYGLLLWKSTGSRRDGYMRDVQTIRTLARFNLSSGAGSVRYSASREWERAAREAERASDTSQLAMAAAESGLGAWRRYLTIRNRAFMSDGFTLKLQTNMRWERRLARDYLESYLRRLSPPTGANEYETALSRFQRAERLTPSSLRNARLLYMALADGNRWAELLAAADRRAASSPFDGQSRFARGLALVRLGRFEPAAAAFDSALATLDDTERARVFSLARLVAPGADIVARGGLDSAARANLSANAKRSTSAFFWAARDPDASTPYNELELEFLARVTFAEFAWSDDELGLHGAETDRAEIYVRYGPPDEILTIPGVASAMQDDLMRKQTPDMDGALLGLSSRDDFASTLLWLYRSGTVFVFDLPPGYGTARMPNVDRGYVRDVQRADPVRWDNLPLPADVDSSLVRVMRFRATTDSVELLIVAQVPGAALRDSSSRRPAQNESAILRLRHVDDRAQITSIATDTLLLGGTSLATRSWVTRQGARSGIIQLEARMPDIPRVSRGLSITEGALPSGFTISDLVLGAPSRSTTSTPATWTALPLTPTIGTFRPNTPVAVGWEAYDLARDTSAQTVRFRVTIAIDRVDRGGVSGLALRALSGVGDALGVTQPTRDGVTVTFDRTIPFQSAAATNVLAESISLEGFGSRTGTYRLTLSLTDLVSGARSTRTTVFRIANVTP